MKKLYCAMRARTLNLILILSLVLSCFVIPIQAHAENVPKNGYQRLAFNTKYSGLIDSGDQFYRYSFDLSKSGNVKILIHTEEKSGLNKIEYFGPRMTLYNNAGDKLFELEMADGNYIADVDLLAGSYYFDLQRNVSYSGSINSFNLSVKYTDSAETRSEHMLDTNNSINTPSTYTLNKSIIGQLAVNDDMDVYSFRLTKPSYVYLNMFTSVIREYSIDITNSSGENVFSQSEIGLGRKKFNCFLPEGLYYFTIHRVRNEYGYYGRYAFTISRTDIPGTQFKKIKNVKKRSVALNWKKSSKASGYQVQISTSKKFKKGTKNQFIEERGTTKHKFSGLKKKKTYYVRIRTFVKTNDGKKHFSGWSKVKTVRVKK